MKKFKVIFTTYMGTEVTEYYRYNLRSTLYDVVSAVLHASPLKKHVKIYSGNKLIKVITKTTFI